MSDLGLILNKSKCRFNEREVEYLGFILDKNGEKPGEGESHSGSDSTTKCLRNSSFLGCINYYCRFVKNMATITSPLYELLQKDIPWSS